MEKPTNQTEKTGGDVESVKETLGTANGPRDRIVLDVKDKLLTGPG